MFLSFGIRIFVKADKTFINIETLGCQNISKVPKIGLVDNEVKEVFKENKTTDKEEEIHGYRGKRLKDETLVVFRVVLYKETV